MILSKNKLILLIIKILFIPSNFFEVNIPMFFFMIKFNDLKKCIGVFVK